MKQEAIDSHRVTAVENASRRTQKNENQSEQQQ